MFVDRDNGDDDAVFGEVLAVADDGFFDFFEGAGVDTDAAGGHGIAAEGAVFSEFDRVAVFEDEDFPGDAAELISERGGAEQGAIFAVGGGGKFWLYGVEDEF